MTPSVPRMRLPLNFTAGRLDVTEQDSPDEISQCVEVICSYQVGFCLDLPEFGITDQTFTENGPDDAVLLREVEAWEPRAQALVDTRPDLIDDAIFNTVIAVRGGTDG